MNKPFLEKSKLTLRAAELLLANNFHAASVSRSYYSTLQTLLHLLFEKLGKTQKDLDSAPRIGTHSQAQYLIELELAKKDKGDYKWFQAKFPEFKELRVKADYHSDALDSNTSRDAISAADTINKRVSKHF